MKVAVFYYWNPAATCHIEWDAVDPKSHAKAGAKCFQALKQAMPGVEAVHLTDETTPMLPGADRAIRLPSDRPLALYRLHHYRSLPADDWLLLDTDIWVQQDVQHVFEVDFDIGVVNRHGTTPVAIAKFHPYNIGVVFSRSLAFWGCAYQRLAALPVKKHEWIGDQSAMNREVATGNWKTLILPGSQYNYFPTGGDDEVSGRAILHYKGWRKDALMLRRTL